jgi:4-amino-4-deoxy-L-arabinose transferase-like glycosyltransferase
VSSRRDPVAWTIAATVVLAHLLVANRYDFFRDELYFIICGRRPAFGYVDQPPLIPLLAAATQTFGESLFLIRLVPALASGGTVLITCALARLAGAGSYGTALAAAGAGFAPMYLGYGTTLGTSTFEPLAWTLIAYLVARALRGEARAWIWAGLAAGVELEIKYALPMYLLPLLAGLLLAGHARALARREVLLAAVLTVLLAAPSLLWQATHGLPFVEMVRATGDKNTRLAPGEFILNQVMVMNPLFAPVWFAGVIAPFAHARLRQWRFLSVTFLLTFVLMMAMHAKDYYLSPAYAGMFALGAVAIEGWLTSRAVRAALIAAPLAISAIAAPSAMPILDPPVLATYLRRIRLTSPPTENKEQSAIPQEFADMLGWRTFVQQMAQAWRALPPEDRARAAIMTSNYGEAAALDYYGAREGLPQAISGHNQYWMWGPRGHDGSVILRANESGILRKRCASLTVVGRFGAPLVMPYEDGAPILLCRGVNLAEVWKEVKNFN